MAIADPRLEQCGFAKIVWDDQEYYVRKYEIVIGRKSKSSNLDIVLGDNMNISRQHAVIRYNFDRGSWELTVMGKNGVTVRSRAADDPVLVTPASPPQVLHSQDVLSMGDRSLSFLLPRQPVVTKKRRTAPKENVALQRAPKHQRVTYGRAEHHPIRAPTYEDYEDEPHGGGGYEYEEEEEGDYRGVDGGSFSRQREGPGHHEGYNDYDEGGSPGAYGTNGLSYR